MTEHTGILARILRVIAGTTARSPRITLLFVFFVSLGAVLLSHFRLGIKTDRADLISPESSYQRRWLEYTKNFGTDSDMVVVAEGKEPQAIRDSLDELAVLVEKEPQHFHHLFYRIDPDRLRSKGLQYLSGDELELLITRLEELGPLLKGHWEQLTLKRLVTGLKYQIDVRKNKASSQDSVEALVQLSDRLADSLSHFAEHPEEFQSPWAELVQIGMKQRQDDGRIRYFMNDQENIAFFLVQPRQEEKNFEGAATAIERLRELIGVVEKNHPRVSFGLTGIPVLEYDEMRGSKMAMIIESIVSYSCVGLMLILGFRGIKHPLLAITMLVVGMTWSFGFATLAVGHLNILSVSFVAIVVGLGIDYAILYISRYLELRGLGYELYSAIESTAEQVGPGILTASCTTSLAFFCAYFSDFLGVSELGLIAGGGILLCSIAAFLVIPPLIAIADRYQRPPGLAVPFQAPALRSFTQRSPAPLAVASLLLIGTIAINGARIRYDYNLMHLQADGVPSVEIQKRLVRESDNRLLFAVSLADSRAEALELKKKFEALPTVLRTEEAASMFPKSPRSETQLLVQGVEVMLSQLPDSLPMANPVNPEQFLTLIETLQEVVEKVGTPAAVSAKLSLARLREQLNKLTPEEQFALLSGYQEGLRAELLGRLKGISSVSDPATVSIEDLPEGMAPRFVSDSGKWLLRIHPKEEIWDIEPLEKFVNDVRSVDPDATGTPLQNYEASQQIRLSYQKVAVYALMASYLVLLVDFLSLKHALVSLLGPLAAIGVLFLTVGDGLSLPVYAAIFLSMTLLVIPMLDWHTFINIVLALFPSIIGGALTVGILGLLNVDFNPANLIILPLILGIGVDNGVHVLHDYRRQSGEYRTTPSLMNALFMTSFSNMGGFASMILAAHRGLRSIGIVLTIGVGSCLFVSVVLLPAILTLLSRYRLHITKEDSGESTLEFPNLEERARTQGLQVYVPPDNAA